MGLWTYLLSKTTVIYNGFLLISQQNPIVAGVISLWGLGVVTFLFLRIPAKIWRLVKRQLTTDLTINNQDTIYYLFLQWLSATQLHSFVRTFNLSHKSYYGYGVSFMTYGYGSNVFLFKGRPVFINRSKVDASATIHSKETMTLTVLGRDTNLITQLFEEVKKSTLDDGVFSVYNYREGSWNLFTTVQKRNGETLSLPKITRKSLNDHLENFANNKKWYTKNGIPYKTGIILHGPPGTGKTSIVACICSELKKDCYILDLNAVGDASLKLAFASVPAGGIILLEDIDIIFAKRKAIEDPSHEPVSNDAEVLKQAMGVPTLGGILNALDGIGCGTNRIVIATTNFYEKLDTALTREGRFDLTLKIDYMTDETLKDYICRLYPDFPRTEVNKWRVNNKVAPCKVQNLVFKNRTEPINVLKEVATKEIPVLLDIRGVQ